MVNHWLMQSTGKQTKSAQWIYSMAIVENENDRTNLLEEELL